VRHSETPAFKLYLRDEDRPRIVTQEEFASLVAPPEPDPQSQSEVHEHKDKLRFLRSVSEAIVEYPVPLCSDGVEIIDTPGTNDLDPLREEITYEFIPKADAVVFLCSTRPPLAETEVRFLRDRILKADIQKIFIVVNFGDLLRSDESRAKMLDYFEQNLAPILGSPKIFLLSARETLRYRVGKATADPNEMVQSFDRFEQSLGTFLASDRGSVKLLKPVNRGLRTARELLEEHLPLRFSAAKMSAQELEITIDTLLPKIETLRQNRDSAVLALRAGLQFAGEELAQRYRQGLRDIAKVAVSRVDQLSAMGGSPTQAQLREIVEEAVASKQTALQQEVSSCQLSSLNALLRKAHHSVQDARDQLRVAVQSAFSLTSIDASVPELDLSLLGELPSRSRNPHGLMEWLGFLVESVVDFFTDSMERTRSAFFSRAREQVSQRFYGIIDSRTANFTAMWKGTSESLERTFLESINPGLNGLEQELHDTLRKHQSAEQQAEREADLLTAIKQSIHGSDTELRELAKELTKK